MPAPDLDRAYADHAVALFAFALALTRSDGEAREVLQDVFVKLAQKTHAESIIDLRAYLLRTVQFCVIDRRRSDNARDRATLRLAGEAPGWFASAEDADVDAFRVALTAALAELPHDQRAVVHLKLWEDRTFAEIAALLGIPANTAASRYRYGLDKLRITLRPLYDEIRHLPLP